MFDVGFSELLLVALVGLIVLGPERLPVAARKAGLWIGRLKRSFNNIKNEVEREIGADEIRRQLHNEQILDLEREMKQSLGLAPKTDATASPTPAPTASPNIAPDAAPTSTVAPASEPPASPSHQDKPQQP
jgi:sec-independent protein translocase protein TatB